MRGLRLRALLTSGLARNTAALYAVHGAGLVLPLVTVPYLARVLRPDTWGLVVFAQSFAAWLTLVVEYGFYLSGTRMVARARGDHAAVARVVGGVQAAKLLLLVASAGLVVVAYLVVPVFRDHPVYMIWAGILAAVQGLNPFWYFQGVERMGAAAALEVSARVAATAGIFLLIRAPEQGWLVLALHAGTGAAWVLCATLWMYREVPFRKPRIADASAMLRAAVGLFVFRSASGVYTQANSFILGLLSTTSAVAFFGGAEKIARGATSLIQPVTQALYPRMSHLVVNDRHAATRVIKVSLLGVTGLGALIGIALLWSAPLLVRVLLGPGYEAATPVLRALALLPPLVALGTVLGIQWALPVGLDRVFYGFVILAAAVNVALAVVLAPRFGASGMALAVVAAEATVAFGLLAYAGVRQRRRREPGGDIPARRAPGGDARAGDALPGPARAAGGGRLEP